MLLLRGLAQEVAQRLRVVLHGGHEDVHGALPHAVAAVAQHAQQHLCDVYTWALHDWAHGPALCRILAPVAVRQGNR